MGNCKMIEGALLLCVAEVFYINNIRFLKV